MGFNIYREYAPVKVFDDIVVICDNGKKFKRNEFQPDNVHGPFDCMYIPQINDKCEGTNTLLPPCDPIIEKKYSVSYPYHTDGSYFKAIMLGLLRFLISFGIGVSIIWITKKMLLYIIYGKNDRER